MLTGATIKLAHVGARRLISKTWGEFTPDDVFDMAVLRSEVFFLEQKITEEEFDRWDRDPSTRHLWVSDQEGMLAYLRIVHDEAAAVDHVGISDSLGRMAVRKNARGQGLALWLLEAALRQVGHTPLYLHAQTYVSSLYSKVGFVEHGHVFEEAGIPHIVMIRDPRA